ncbi:DUF6176 family protein [Ornithinibacillus bavariensis]|uniref:Uncharacterized protein n=1 Tax=Ornithinibacillus bavariensis TaxID=545502 RepID=A0A919XBS3_9BACI|nr:DUF6176 family protein [Ornithinibacillus bavariensis]GIO27770.1 hypothetical protein J43TS3_23810 [Ornithinibacillus bavariensis]
MNVELTRFKVKEGKTEKVDEWLKFLNDNMKDVLLTLEDEKMYVETIFRETLNGEVYLYWYSVQGEGGQAVEESESWIDKKHLQFWDECIDPTFRPVDLNTEVVMIPEKVRKAMD